MNNILKIYTISFIFILQFTKIYAENTTVLVQDNVPLYYFIDEQQNYNGFYIDLTKALLGENKFILANNYNKDADIILFSTTHKIPNNYEFIAIPQIINYVVFVRKKNDINSLSELYDKKIIVKKNDLPYHFLYEYRTSHIYTVPSYADALKTLELGINDGAILPYQIGINIINKNKLKGIDYLNVPFLIQKSGFAVNKDKPELIKLLKHNLNEIIKSGEFKKIENKWFPFSFKQSKSKLLIAIIIILVIIIVVYLYIHKMVQKEISQTTKNYINFVKHNKGKLLEIDTENMFFDKILNKLPYAWILINDKKGKILFSNTEFKEDFDLTKPPDTECFMSDIFSENIVEEFNKLDNKLFSLLESFIITPINIERKKTKKWIIKIAIKLKHFEGKYILNIMLNPMFNSELLLNKVSEKFLLQSIINAFPDLIFYKNREGEYLGGNKAFSKKINMPNEEYIGKKDKELFSKELSEYFIKTDKIVFDTKELWVGKNVENSENGDKQYYETTKIPLKNKHGNIFGLIGVSRNITRHHVAEKQMELAKRQAEESNRIKLSFLTNMSHEIRTPMNTIIGFSDLMADPDLTYDQRMEIIGIVKTNGFRLIDVIDDIIDISMIESEQIYIKHSNFNLNNTIEDVYKYAENKKVQMEKELVNITCHFGIIKDEFNIVSDTFRIKQSLKNLINIAIRYTNSENINLGYIIDNECIVFYIQNDKPLEKYDEIKHLIDQQTTYNNSLKEKQNMSELSLVIAKNIIERLNGELVIDDYNSGKTNFYFKLPLQEYKATKNKVININTTTEYPDWTGKNILIAEDEAVNFQLLKEMISITGANIFQANNGREAVDIYKKKHIDFVLMDIKMPILNGIEASQLILKQNPNGIIIAQTAYDLKYEKQQCEKIGVKKVMTKPIDPNEFYYLANKYLIELKNI